MFQNGIYGEFIARLRAQTGRKGGELADEVAREEFGARGESCFVGADIGDFDATGKLAAGVHRGAFEVFDAVVVGAEEDLEILEFFPVSVVR